MRKLSTFLIGVCLLLNGVGVFAASTASQRLSERLDSIHSFQAAFMQNTYDMRHRLIQKSVGMMQFQRPNKFRWQIKSPNQQVVVTNGQWLWIYDVALKQVTKQKAAETNLSAAGILSGDTKKVLSHFTVSQVNKKANEQIFKLMPNASQAQAFSYIEIIFSGKSLRSIVIKNKLNQLNQFKFLKSVVNTSLPESLFQFKPPAGVDTLS